LYFSKCLYFFFLLVHSVVRFDTSALPPGASVSQVQIRLTSCSATECPHYLNDTILDDIISTASAFAIYQCTNGNSWVESTFTFNTATWASSGSMLNLAYLFFFFFFFSFKTFFLFSSFWLHKSYSRVNSRNNNHKLDWFDWRW